MKNIEVKRVFKDEIRDCFPRVNGKIAIPINLDFDGTVIMHGYFQDAEKFKVNGDAINILKRWVKEYNCCINLYTTRDETKLDEAIFFCNENGLMINSVNNTSKWQRQWSKSSKQYGFVIDDMSCLKVYYDENGRAAVDWNFVVEMFEPRLKHMKELIDEIENEN